MKRILTILLCLALMTGAALAEDTVCYVNPDGGQFYHADPQCPSMSERYWDSLIALTPAQLAEPPYGALSACPFCVAEPVQPGAMAWISSFDTALDVRIDAPGTYLADSARADAPLTAGLYTVTTDSQCDGLLTTALGDGTAVHAFTLHGEASYSFYLADGMLVTLPEHAVLTPIAKTDSFPERPERETIRQARRMPFYEMQRYVYAASAIDGQEACIVISSLDAEMGLEAPTVIPIPAGETVIFDTDMNGVNDPMPQKYFADPANEAYFIEFINCVVWPVDMGNG